MGGLTRYGIEFNPFNWSGWIRSFCLFSNCLAHSAIAIKMKMSSYSLIVLLNVVNVEITYYCSN